VDGWFVQSDPSGSGIFAGDLGLAGRELTLRSMILTNLEPRPFRVMAGSRKSRDENSQIPQISQIQIRFRELEREPERERIRVQAACQVSSVRCQVAATVRLSSRPKPRLGRGEEKAPGDAQTANPELGTQELGMVRL